MGDIFFFFAKKGKANLLEWFSVNVLVVHMKMFLDFRACFLSGDNIQNRGLQTEDWQT